MSDTEKIKRGQGGKFVKGTIGKYKGVKSKKNQQWEALNEAIIGEHAEKFNDIMREFASGAEDQQEVYMNNFIKVLEFFKPKLSRAALSNDGDTPLVQVIINKKI